MKFQNPWGSCWAFGATAAIESSLLSSLGRTYAETVNPGDEGKEGAGLDVSERHLEWFAYHPITKAENPNQVGEGIHVVQESHNPNALYNVGGWNIFITTLLSSGVGPVSEEYFPYKGNEGFTD